MQWTDGSTYEGDWVRGIQHGKGKMTFPDGSVKEGYFENNVYKGEDPPVITHTITKKSSGLKSLSNSNSKHRLNRSSSKLSNSSRRGQKSSSRIMFTDNKGSPKGSSSKLMTDANRKNTNSSRDFSNQNQLNTSNPNTGYINDNNVGQATLPASIIQKPRKKRKNGSSESNSSFGDGPSPYNLGRDKDSNAGDEDIKTYNTIRSKKNSQLEPIFKTSTKSKKKKLSPQSRSHYGQFPGQTPIMKGGEKMRSGSSGQKKKKLSPIRKPHQVIQKQ